MIGHSNPIALTPLSTHLSHPVSVANYPSNIHHHTLHSSHSLHTVTHIHGVIQVFELDKCKAPGASSLQKRQAPPLNTDTDMRVRTHTPHTHTHIHKHTQALLCICCNSTLSYTSPTSAWCLTHTDDHCCTPLLPWSPTTQHWFSGSKAVGGGLCSQANGHPLYRGTSLFYTCTTGHYKDLSLVLQPRPLQCT